MAAVGPRPVTADGQSVLIVCTGVAGYEPVCLLLGRACRRSRLRWNARNDEQRRSAYGTVSSVPHEQYPISRDPMLAEPHSSRGSFAQDAVWPQPAMQ